uniref:Uncharacterized protein n=1 Tax=Odontella aurita TaxID=265563 RepID=A0A7S4J1K7_9STRA|mmetsp:Transcript_35433/g.105812  ORF Transcript_35433/g.105812 Transcript_35433/m.105812 type:complete len:223 (+) Transcript_35433:379-1047(+)
MRFIDAALIGKVASLALQTSAFVPVRPRALSRIKTDKSITVLHESVVNDSASKGDTTENAEDNETTAVRAPLNFIGPYPCLSLRFPELATVSQRERNVTGVSLDFVLDTAANTNTINAQVALELGLNKVGEALPGVGAGGAISGGDTYMLGDCELDGLPEDDRFTFMSGLTASALPVASPSAAGLLGVYFFNAFPGGVELSWDMSGSKPPAATFFSDPEKNG